ncbi:TIR domain-containing adapter molecule 1-like [Ambystoma mexicanum]|uniref:TIR domain-containing adapter molecule 1-like n=1 Tax=Ambystoma mexicanum TaxID=8296 RepID=UPI0037E78DA6
MALSRLPASLEDVFHNVSAFPRKRLLELRSKLQHAPATNSGTILEAIVLNVLGQTSSALELLRDFPNTEVAQYLVKKIENEGLQCKDTLLAQPHDPEFLQTVDQVLTLLQKENMWTDTDQPHTLISRTDSHPTPILPRVSSPGIPINSGKKKATPVSGSSRYSNSVDSLNSNLAISQSPTALFLTVPGCHTHQKRALSKLCEDTTSYPIQPTDGGHGLMLGEMDDSNVLVVHNIHPTEKTASASVDSVLTATSTEQYPVECTDISSPIQLVIGVTETHNICAKHPQETSSLLPAPLLENTCPTWLPVEGASLPKDMVDKEKVPSTPSTPIEDASSPKEREVKEPPASEPLHANTLSTEPDSGENTFFSFVILHVKGDEEIASLVRDTLEGIGIANGTTFHDGFLRPGCSLLNCLQDAIVNSAFTVLLLSQRWKSGWANAQANAALMNAIENKPKYNTVIPFLPREDRLQKHNMPLWLKSLNPLDESLPNFTNTVKRTFKPLEIKRQKQIWQKEEQIRALQRRIEDVEVNEDLARRNHEVLSELMSQRNCFPPHPSYPWPHSMDGGAGIFPPGVPPFQQFPCTPGTPGYYPPFPFCPFPPSQVYNVPPPFYPHGAYGPAQIVYQQQAGAPPGTQYASAGQHQVIQIQHASRVQIGDQNQMRVEGAEEEAESTNEDEQCV